MKLPIIQTSLTALALLVLLNGCSSPVPDHRIKLVRSTDGRHVTAVPPECLSWAEYDTGSPFDNNPWPQYGCAQARNLAAQVERPEDLMEAKEMGSPDSYVANAATTRYQAGKSTPLIDPNASAPAQVIKMEDSRTGGGQPKQ